MSASAVPTSAVVSNAAPIAPGERLAHLDLLRGVASFGILAVNMAYLAGPQMQWEFALLDPWNEPADVWTQHVIAVLFAGKFYPLFSLLFGVGFAIQDMRAAAAGRPLAPVYARRLFTLMLIGLVHALLIWYGDILVVYALLGWILLVTRGWSVQALLGLSATAWCVQLLLYAGLMGLHLLGALLGGAGADSAFDADMAKWASEAARIYQSGSYLELAGQRATDYVIGLFYALLVAPTIVAMFLLGAALARSSAILDPHSHRKLWRILGTGVTPAALLVTVASEWVLANARSPMALGAIAAEFVAVLVGPFLMLGYIGLILMAAGSAKLPPAGLRPLMAVGRMPLSNYLLQSLICTTLFYSYGLGWFGQISPMESVAVILGVFAVQLIFSSLWLSYFSLGPVE